MRLSNLFTRHLGLKFLALVMAAVLWSMAVGREKAEIGLNVPLEMVNFPPDMVVANQIPDGISVRIRGSAALTRQLANRKLRFSINLAETKEGPNNFTLLPDALSLPRGLEVTRLTPSTITVELERLTTKTLSLLPVIQGEPIPGYMIDEITLEPGQVDVRGPERLLGGLGRLWTEPIDVTKLTQSAVIPIKPSLPDVSVTLAKPVEIKAQIRIGEKIVTRPFNDVPMEVVNAANKYEIHKDTVDLSIRGPLNTMTELGAGKGLKVVLNLAGLEPGTYKRRPVVVVPVNMEVLEVDPKEIRVKIFEEKLPVTNEQH